MLKNNQKPLGESFLAHEDGESLEAVRVMARALSEVSDKDERLGLARAFGHRLVSAWWSALTTQLRCSDPLRELLQPFPVAVLPAPAKAMADSIGEAAARLDAESAAYEIGLTYTGMLPRELRGELGIYYTPPALTARLIDQATASGVDWTVCRVLDPACGGGAFLAPVAGRIMAALPGCGPRILIENIGNRLRGFEIDPFGAWLSQVTLDAILLPVTMKSGTRLPVVVTVCDSLRRSPPRDRFDLVIGNPPYGRVRLEAAERERFKRCLYGHSNLYGLFTDIALRQAKPDGVVAYVTPTSFLAGEYFKNLRALLGRDAPPVTIDFVSVRRGVFEDVLQETLLATYRRGRKPGKVSVHEITPTDSRTLDVTKAGAVPLPSDRSQPWILPRARRQAALVSRLSGMSTRLADWGYTVSTGPLVWNRFKDQLTNDEGPDTLPLIWAESVTADGRFVFRAEKKNHTRFFEVRDRDGWLVTNKPCVLLQRTTAKEQTRRLMAATLPTSFLRRHKAVVIENHLNMLRPIVDVPAVCAEVLAAFLNSEAADRAFRCVSGSVAVSAYELEALPLPCPGELSALSQRIKERADKSVIERECSRLYSGMA